MSSDDEEAPWSATDSDPPAHRCGFELLPEDVSKNNPNDVLGKWRISADSASCCREVWEDGRCRWHVGAEPSVLRDAVDERDERVQNLDGVTLRDVTLDEGVSFAGCQLQGATFENVTARKLDFAGCNLQYAQFPDVHFLRAQFPGADLRDAQFPDAYLYITQFPDAYLTRAQFSDASLLSPKFSEADLVGAYFPSADLSYAEFPDADLSHAEFPDAILYRVRFPDADLTEADFLDADLTEAQFPDASLRDTTFHRSKMHQADLTRADARDAEFTPGDGSEPTNLEDAVLRETDLRGADLSKARLYEADLTNARINRKTTFDDTTVYERNPELSGWFRETTDTYGAAAWVHRRLERLYETAAASEEARAYHIRKQEAERAGHKRRALQRLRKLKRSVTQQLDSYKQRAIQWLCELTTRVKQRYSTLWPGGANDTVGENDDEDETSSEQIATDQQSDTEDGSDSAAAVHNDSGTNIDDTDSPDDSDTLDDTKTSDYADDTDPPTTPLVSAYRYLSLSLMYYLSKHGESLQRIGWRATQIIVVAGVLYPLAGGVKSDSNKTLHEFPGGDVLAADSLSAALSLVVGGLGEFLWGLYFSVITFTTIGYGDLYPVGTAAKVLVGAESLSGAVLVALFVFVLGRRVAR